MPLFLTPNLLFHLKNMKCSASLSMFLMWRENLLSYDNMRGFFFARSGGQRDVIFHEKKYSQNSACLVKKIICLIFNKLTDLLIQATNLEARAPQIKCLGSPKAPLKFSLEYSLECGSAFCEDISKGMEILVNYPILLTYMVVI